MAQGYRGKELWGTVLGRPLDADGPYWGLRANGGIHSTGYDMLRWVQALLEGRILSAESLKMCWTPHVREAGDAHYGYGWSIATGPNNLKVVTHNGGNGIFFADLAIVPDEKWAFFFMTNVAASLPGANDLKDTIGFRFLDGRPYPAIPDVREIPEGSLPSFCGDYELAGKDGRFRVSVEGEGLALEPQGWKAFSALHSVSAIDAARCERLNRLLDKIVAANRAANFKLQFKAYGGRVPLERLKERWQEITGEIEAVNGPILRHEILGTARTTERDETVVRFIGERGNAERTYVWAMDREASLLGMSVRGLSVRLHFVPVGGMEFASWDGGLRPSKRLRFTAQPGGGMTLQLGEVGLPAMRK